MKGRVILAGGSGFLGKSLAAFLEEKGYEPIILSRKPGRSRWKTLAWDGRSQGPWVGEFQGAAAVINLAGRSVNCRYNEANRKEIISSRVDSVRAVEEALASCSNRPGVVIQSGSLAIYGNSGEAWVDESSRPGQGFSPEVCKLWESTFCEKQTNGVRRVYLRISFALGPHEGALGTLSKLVRCFLGGAAGTGRQYMSWIHQRDLNRLFLRALEDPSMKGTYNATAPNPATNAEFMRALRSVLHRPWCPPVPRPLVKLGAWAMGTESELALHGRRATPKRLIEEGFQFEYPDLLPALRSVHSPVGQA